MPTAHDRSISDVAAALDTDIARGLAPEEATRRLAAEGRNEIRRGERASGERHAREAWRRSERDRGGRNPVDDGGEELVLDALDARVEACRVIVREDGDGALGEDRPRVDASVDDVHRAAAHANASSDRLLGPVLAGKARQEGRVHVQDAPWQAPQHGCTQHAHEARQHDQLGFVLGDRRCQGFVPVIAVGVILRPHDAGRDLARAREV